MPLHADMYQTLRRVLQDFPKRAAQASKRKVQATSGQLQRLRVGWLRRQWRKLLVEIRAWL